MKAQHTPGPWEAHFGSRDAEIESSEHEYPPVCSVYNTGCEEEETRGMAQANARLIEAAPELLRVLKIMVGDVNGEWYKARNMDAIEIIRKAEGRDVA